MKTLRVRYYFLWELHKVPMRSVFFALFALTFFFQVNSGSCNAQSSQLKNIITGRITDSKTGQPILYATVHVKGDSVNAVSDLNGEFTIPVPDQKSVLVFSSIDHKTVTLKPGRNKYISLVMSSEESGSDEPVTVGYGVQPGESLLASIFQVSGDVLTQNFQGNDLRTRLAESVPGLNLKLKSIGFQGYGIWGGTGMLTDEQFQSLLDIRGSRTWNNSGALVLVDGTERPIENISPYEIDKVTVLKDAAGTSLFGVKAANGVILLTTRRGREGKPKLSIEGNFSLKTFNNIPGILGSYEANLLRNYAILNEVSVNPSSWNSVVPGHYLELLKNHTYPEYLPDVDLKEALLREYSSDQSINMTITGGTRLIKYFTALSYSHEGDPFNISEAGQNDTPGFLFDRFNFRGNFDFNITSLTRLSSNIQGYFLSQQQSNGLDNYSYWNSIIINNPPDISPIKYSDGTWARSENFGSYKNVEYVMGNFGYKKYNMTGINTDFMLTQDLDFIARGLSVKGKLSLDNNFKSRGPEFTGSEKITKYIKPEIVDELHPGISKAEINALETKYTTWYVPDVTDKHGFDWTDPPDTYSSETGINNTTCRNIYYEVTLNYARSSGKHTVTGLALFSRQEQGIRDLNLAGFPITYHENWAGRATYGYDKRYLVELNGAYNGSEKFGPGHKFGFFPSLAIGWVTSNEAFFENLKPYISRLKFRYSEGLTGSDAGMERWLYIGNWSLSNYTWWFGNYGYPSKPNLSYLRYEKVIPNPDIHWEKSYMKNFGIETGFLDDQIKINFDYFIDDRTDIFVEGTERIIPDYFGKPAVSLNLGHINSHGFEFDLQFSKNTASSLNYWFNHSWTFAAEKIIRRADPALKSSYQKLEGFQIDQPKYLLNQSSHPMQSWNDVYNTAGLTDNTSILPGDFCQVDYNADGIIDSNDVIPYGYTLRPQYTYSPAAGLSWKYLSAHVRFYGICNISGMPAEYQRTSWHQNNNIVYPNNKNLSWSPEFNQTETATNPALRFSTASSTGYIDNPLSYLVLQNVEIALNFSPEWLTKKGLNNLRLAVNGNNLYVWAKSKSICYSGFERPTYTNSSLSNSLIRRIAFSLSFYL